MSFPTLFNSFTNTVGGRLNISLPGITSLQDPDSASTDPAVSPVASGNSDVPPLALDSQSATPRIRPNLEIQGLNLFEEMPPTTSSGVGNGMPMTNEIHEQPEANSDGRAVSSNATTALPSSENPTGPRDTNPRLPLPNPLLAGFKIISSRLIWDRVIGVNQRNQVEEWIHKFDNLCYNSMPNPDHTRLLRMFALILYHGVPNVIVIARFQNAFSRWMNSADFDTVMWPFYEYCYIPVYCSIQADPTLHSPAKGFLTSKWRDFASMGVRAFPQIDLRPFRTNVPIELKDSKMIYRTCHIEYKKATKQIPNVTNPYLLSKPEPTGESSSAGAGSQQPLLPFDNPFAKKALEGEGPFAESGSVQSSRSKESKGDETESADDLIYKAFKPGHLENPELFKSHLDREKEHWDNLERQTAYKSHEPTFTHSCKCEDCVDTFGIENC